MILMTGLLISVLSNLLERRIDNLKDGRVHYKFKDHFVIIGYDRMTISLIKQLAKENKGKDIVLQTIQNVPAVRHELFSYLNKDMEKNVIILSGNRNSKEDLGRLSLNNAKKLFIFGEMEEYDHDSLNIECLKKIRRILFREEKKSAIKKFFSIRKQKETEIPCHILFENQSTYAILQQQDLVEFLNDDSQESRSETATIRLEFLPFNFQELWAQKIFVDQKYSCPDDETENIKYLPLDREGINYDSEKTVHLVILGMSKMGIALGIEASHLCHFPNFIRNKKLKTKITFIDENADQEMNFLKGRYRHFFKEIDYSYEDSSNPANNKDNRKDVNIKGDEEKYTDIEWQFIKGRIEEPAIQNKLEEFSRENTHLTVAICFNLPAAAIASGLYLPDEMYQEKIQILIKQDTPYSILSMLKTTNKYRNVKPFGMLDNSLDLSKTDDIPIIIKYIYDLYYDEQRQATEIPDIEELKRKWKSLKTVKKWSNRYNANTIDIKQKSFNIQEDDDMNDNEVKLLAQVEHNRWNIEELLLGYRPTKEEERIEIGRSSVKKDSLKAQFIHNDICPFDKISDMDIEPGINRIKNSKEYDLCISKAIPMIIKYKRENSKNEEL
ncbi:hypothetical protein LJC52_02275 [Bacteroidales bacterium OttesenSCG-928-A17]|nr:hypothetical protein [Bacteroidales bacterium OttesenSCG-928-A17]